MTQIPQAFLFFFSANNPVCYHKNLLYNSPQRYEKYHFWRNINLYFAKNDIFLKIWRVFTITPLG